MVRAVEGGATPSSVRFLYHVAEAAAKKNLCAVSSRSRRSASDIISAVGTLERALALAAAAHAGQKDKAGQPYILHPIRVMLNVRTDEERTAALLHDVVEDTSTTFEDLRREGFSDAVIESVRALTKHEGESREAAARRAVVNPIARNVKLADVTDNMDLSRIPNSTEADFARLEEYKRVKAILLAGPN